MDRTDAKRPRRRFPGPSLFQSGDLVVAVFFVFVLFLSFPFYGLYRFCIGRSVVPIVVVTVLDNCPGRSWSPSPRRFAVCGPVVVTPVIVTAVAGCAVVSDVARADDRLRLRFYRVTRAGR